MSRPTPEEKLSNLYKATIKSWEAEIDAARKLVEEQEALIADRVAKCKALSSKIRELGRRHWNMNS